MKKLLFAALAAFSVSAFAQKPITVDVVAQPTDKDGQHSFVVEIPQVTLKDVETDWHNYIGKKSKGKSVVENGAHVQFGATNKNISLERFEVYSKLLETPGGVHLTVWLKQNNTALSGLDLAVQKYLRDFAIPEYREVVQRELKTELDKQKEMEKELAELIENQEKSMKTISENERSKESTKDAIATNNRDIESTSLEIYDQKEMVELTSSDPNANKGAEKTLDGLKDEKKDLQKENKKQGENIDDLSKENREEKRNMTSTEQQISWKTADIEKQKILVREVLTKLSNIR